MEGKSRYILSQVAYGGVYYSPKGPIELGENTSQSDLKYLSEECGLQHIQKGQKPMSLAEQIKVAEADLEQLKKGLAKEKKAK